MPRERTCVACRGQGDDNELVRLCLAPSGELVVDLKGKLPGRGAWVHPQRSCVDQVAKKPGGLARTLRGKVDASDLLERMRAIVLQSALDGLSQAAAAGALVGGHDALARELEAGRILMLVQAEDASERTVASLQAAAGDNVPMVILPLGRNDLGARIGRGPRAALGVAPSRAARHLRLQLRRLRQLG